MRELKLEELSVRQKLGMSMTAYVADNKDNMDYIIELIENHSLGAVWINPESDNHAEKMARIKAAADYPILIMCDAETGIGEYPIGKHNALGSTGSEELAYLFGKVVGVTAHALGYNVVCNPVLDMANGKYTCGGNSRSLGNDKYKVTSLAMAEAKGMHDSGILTVAKHYPGKADDGKRIDSHMAEVKSHATVEEVVNYNLYPYIELNKAGLLDGIMTAHARFVNIDDEYPASLSKKVTGIIRELGFDGFFITDALMMMGVVARFGWRDPIGLAIAGGNDISLPYIPDNEKAYDYACQCYDAGIITDERLDEAVSRVLAAQHKTLAEPKFTSLTDKEKADFDKLSTDAVYAYVDEGLTTSISRDGKHYFVILTETEVELNDTTKIEVDTFSTEWYNPIKISEKLKSLFPNSEIRTLSQFPVVNKMRHTLQDAIDYEDVVFITFFNTKAYLGIEAFTPRIISLFNAFQATDSISTVVHLGNPYMMEEIPHVSRIIVGPVCEKGVDTAIEVLAGNYPAKGVPTYDIKLQ